MSKQAEPSTLRNGWSSNFPEQAGQSDWASLALSLSSNGLWASHASRSDGLSTSYSQLFGTSWSWFLTNRLCRIIHALMHVFYCFLHCCLVSPQTGACSGSGSGSPTGSSHLGVPRSQPCGFFIFLFRSNLMLLRTTSWLTVTDITIMKLASATTAVGLLYWLVRQEFSKAHGSHQPRCKKARGCQSSCSAPCLGFDWLKQISTQNKKHDENNKMQQESILEHHPLMMYEYRACWVEECNLRGVNISCWCYFAFTFHFCRTLHEHHGWLDTYLMMTPPRLLHSWLYSTSWLLSYLVLLEEAEYDGCALCYKCVVKFRVEPDELDAWMY